MWLLKTLSNPKADSLFGWGLNGQSLHVLCQNKDLIRHELSQSCRWVMGLQARGRVADSEIRTKNKPPAGPLFVDLSVLTQQIGTRTDLKTSRRCSFFFLMKKLKCLWLKKSNHFSLQERVLLEEQGHSQFGFCLYHGHKKRSIRHFYFSLSFQHVKLGCLLNSFPNWAHGNLEVCKTKTHCVVMWGVQILTSVIIYISKTEMGHHAESYLPQKGVKRKRVTLV